MEIAPNKYKRLDILEAVVLKNICNLMHFRFQCVHVTFFFYAFSS